MKYATVKFECPNCQGQINVVGAVVYPTYARLVGRCAGCNKEACLDVFEILKTMSDLNGDTKH